MEMIQKQDLSPLDFSNNNSLAAGGVRVKVTVGSAVGDAIAAAIAALPADKYLTGLSSYDPVTNVLSLAMSDGGTVPVSMAGLVADAVAEALAAADGSETVVQAGANLVLTGTGTAANPYVLSAPGLTGPAGGALTGNYPNPGLNAASVVNAVEDAISADPGAQLAIANAIADDVVGTPAFAAAINAALAAAAPNLKDCAGVPHAVNANVPTCVEMGAAITGAVDTATDALEAAIAAATTPAAIVNAVESGIAADTGAQAAIAGAIVDDIVTNPAFAAAVAAAAPRLKDCAGVDHVAGANVPTCTEMGAAIAAATTPAAIVNAVESGIAADAGAQAAIAAAIVDDLVATPAFAAAVAAAETTTTLVVSGVNYVYTNEDNVQTVIQPAQFVSAGAGNGLSVDGTGRLFVAAQAMIDDDQVLTGDNTGSVTVTLTPTTIPDPVDPTVDQVNYAIKADLKLAALTPTNGVNLLTLGASGFYVSAEEVADAISDSAAATANILAGILADPGALAALAAALSITLLDAFEEESSGGTGGSGGAAPDTPIGSIVAGIIADPASLQALAAALLPLIPDAFEA